MIHAGQWRATGLCRQLSLTAYNTKGISLLTSRAASLSAIHRGVRRSERVQFGAQSDRGRSSRLTDRAFDGAASPRQQQKLRKKLDRKAFGEEEEESGRQTRRKRFTDPESSFGKKSLVYQLKHGAFRDEAASLPLDEPVRPLPFRPLRPELRSRRGAQDWENSRPGAQMYDRKRDPAARAPWENSRLDAQKYDKRDPIRRASWDNSRPDAQKYDGNEDSAPRAPWRNSRPNTQRYDSGEDHTLRAQWGDSRPNASKYDGKEDASLRAPWGNSRPDAPKYDREDDVPERRPKRPMMPMNIKYTTAASQFLYGKSVVKAALEHGRRMLYNLYIYGGDNRKDSKDNAIITRLAEKRGVPVTIVPNGEQRLMDKMSMGRPHNGFVLETSPLPQLPVTSLGRLEESPARLGFHVELDHQSKEEEAINGRDTFVARKNDITPKPFVLLLNEILDPGNLGALLRTASYLGVDAVGITNRSTSTLTPVVLKSAAGAVEEVTIFTVDSPLKFIEDSKKAGWKTYAAVAPPELKLARKHCDKFISTDDIIQDDPLANNPCILVLGNEGHGLSKPIKVAADYELSVPRFVQNSTVDSLNVSVAAGLLCHAFVTANPAEKSVSAESKADSEASSEATYETKERDALF